MSKDDQNDGTSAGTEDEALPDFIETEEDEANKADAEAAAPEAAAPEAAAPEAAAEPEAAEPEAAEPEAAEPDSDQWYYEANGNQEGPVSQEQLQGLLSDGSVSGETKIWQNGMANWTPATGVDTFSVPVSASSDAASGSEAEPVAESTAAPAVSHRRSGRRASKDEGEPVVWIEPNEDGIFEGEPVDEKEIENWVPEEAYGGTGHNKIALTVMSVCVAVIVGHFILIGASESRSQEVQAFMDGNIVQHKTAEVLRLKKKWRSEDARARNIYGDVTLTYFPADSQVKVTQVTRFQDGDSWRKEMANHKEVGRKDMPNDTAKLTEGQTIERLPLLNLPIFEAEKGEDGSVDKVYAYEYEIEFTREGYHPQKKTWRKDTWQRVGPGNRIIDWSGLDLVPKPETIKENFAKAMGDIHCLMKLHEIPTIQQASSHENFEMLLLRNRIKTLGDFDAAKDLLTLPTGEHAEWWKVKQEEIAKRDCGPAADKK